MNGINNQPSSSFDKRLQEEENKNKENALKNIYNTTQEELSNVKRKLKDNSGKISDIVFLVISSIAVLTIVGLIELIDGEFDFSRYSTISFWVEYLMIQIASWLMRILYKIVGDRKEYRENMTYHAIKKDIQKIVDYDNEKPFIDIYAEKDRINRKTIAWKNKIRYKILKICNKYKINNIVRHLNNPLNSDIDTLEPFELKSDIITLNNSKKALKVNKMIDELMRQLTKQWIDNNLDMQKVKYNNVSKTILVNGFSSNSGNDSGIGNNYQENNFKHFINDNIVGFLITAIFLFLIIPMIGSGFKKDPTAWLKFLTKAFTVFFAGIMSWWNNNQLFTKTKIKALTERNDTLNKYYKDFTKDNK